MFFFVGLKYDSVVISDLSSSVFPSFFLFCFVCAYVYVCAGMGVGVGVHACRYVGVLCACERVCQCMM